jgi:hypothetical protein
MIRIIKNLLVTILGTYIFFYLCFLVMTRPWGTFLNYLKVGLDHSFIPTVYVLGEILPILLFYWVYSLKSKSAGLFITIFLFGCLWSFLYVTIFVSKLARFFPIVINMPVPG